jgi:hypothetical protein
MHPLALGGGALASLCVVCPEPVQRQGIKGDFRDGNDFTNQILHGDCIEVMRQMPSNSIHFVLTDPPYLVNYRDRSGCTIQNDVDETWLKPAMAAAYRVLKQDRIAVMFYGWTNIADVPCRSAGLRPDRREPMGERGQRS